MATRRFYATVQNKMHYAVHGHTAAELIVERADADKEHMGLTTWADAPDGKIRKSDVVIAKNYLSDTELGQLERMVTAYLDFAVTMTMRHIPLTMADWEQRLNSFINLFEYGLLKDAGRVTDEIARLHAETEFEKYRIIQDQLFMSDYDRFLLEMKEVEQKNQDSRKGGIAVKDLYLAGGPYYGVQEVFSRIKGVVETTAGFANSSVPNPRKEDVENGKVQAVECVKVTYNPKKIDIGTLLSVFFTIVNLYTDVIQSKCTEPHYRTVIYYVSL